MDTRTTAHTFPGASGAAFFKRLIVAWIVILITAVLYCLLRSLVDSEYAYQSGATLKWAIIHWGAWPALLPVSFKLLRTFERRLSFGAGLVASAAAATIGASLFAYCMQLAFGEARSLYQASYHMAPIALGTYLVFGLIFARQLYPAVFHADLRQDLQADDEALELHVWKGRVQTTIDARRIEWVRAARNYVECHAGGQSYLMRTSMAELERLLPEHWFLRTHRSYLINRRFVTGVAGGTTRPCIVLKSGSRLPVGKTYRQSVLATTMPDTAKT